MDSFWKAAIARHDHALVLSLLASGLRLDDARDVAQEAWLRVIEASATGRLTHLELPGLVIRQASFIVLDRQRASTLRTHVPEDEAATLPADERADHQAHARELLATLEAGLATATPRQREVFFTVLAAPDAGHRELAARRGLSLQRFRQVLCDVRARLRRALEED